MGASRDTLAVGQSQAVSRYTPYNADTEAHGTSTEARGKRQMGCGAIISDPRCRASTEDLTKGRYNASTEALTDGGKPRQRPSARMHTQTLSQFANRKRPLYNAVRGRQNTL